MKLKFYPVYYNPYADPEHKINPNTTFEYVDENTLKIDGELYEFDTESIVWPDIYTQTNGKITSARRDDTGELYLDVVRKYHYEDAGSVIPQPEWDTGEYHDINR